MARPLPSAPVVADAQRLNTSPSASAEKEPAPEPLDCSLPRLLRAETPTYGYEPPPLLAKADATAPRSAVTAKNVAMVADRTLLTTRLGMPGSFRGPGAGLRPQNMLVWRQCQLLLNAYNHQRWHCPSLASLDMIAGRLTTTAVAILESVERQLEGETDIGSNDQAALPRRG